MSLSVKNRKIAWLDIMKGILIALVVFLHTYANHYFLGYLLCNTVFFMISGYCWNDRHSNGFTSLKNYFLQLIKRLYIPFIGINISSIILNNLFIKLGIYTDSPLLLELVKDPPLRQVVSHYYSFSETLKEIGKTLLFAGGAARICGATWFLTTMFMVRLFHCIFIWITRRRNINSIYSTLFMLLVSLILSWILQEKHISLMGSIKRFPAAYSAYLFGILTRKGLDWLHTKEISKAEFSMPFNIAAAVISLTALVILHNHGIHIDMAHSIIPNPVTYVLCMIVGWLLVKNTAILLSNIQIVNRTLLFLGKRTIPILLFHTLAYKIISKLYIVFTDTDPILLASYPVIYSSPQWVRYLYLLTGIVVPLLLYQVICSVEKQNTIHSKWLKYDIERLVDSFTSTEKDCTKRLRRSEISGEIVK